MKLAASTSGPLGGFPAATMDFKPYGRCGFCQSLRVTLFLGELTWTNAQSIVMIGSEWLCGWSCYSDWRSHIANTLRLGIEPKMR